MLALPRSGRARCARDDRRRRCPRRHRPAVAPLAFLERAPRLEILYHSIHYLDTIRWLAGEPDGRLLPGGRPPGACRSSATRAARSSSTTGIAPLLAGHEPHTSAGSALPGVAVDGRRHGAAPPGSTLGRQPRLPDRAARQHGGRVRARLDAGPAARVVVHGGVRRADVEPAAVRRRRRRRAGRLGRRTRSGRWRWSRRATSRAARRRRRYRPAEWSAMRDRRAPAFLAIRPRRVRLDRRLDGARCVATSCRRICGSR